MSVCLETFKSKQEYLSIFHMINLVYHHQQLKCCHLLHYKESYVKTRR